MTNQDILNLLHHEVTPAIGCTEPIAVALCVAKATENLGHEPEQIKVNVSKNIYKNAMGVGIPNTGMTGLPIAIALGATIGKSAYQLEVLRDAKTEDIHYAKEYLARTPIHIDIEEQNKSILYIHAEVRFAQQTAMATIQDEHTHFIEEDCKAAMPIDMDDTKQPTLTLRQVYDFATSVDTEQLLFLLQGAQMNIAAAERSFSTHYGHGLGKLLQQPKDHLERLYGNTLLTKIISYTCGACDARMAGAMVPVMSNSGSGNQGIACSIPVYLYAQENHSAQQDLLRALAISNVTVIYMKQSLGRLSALCGCVVAATGSAAGITYLMGGQYTEITYAIKNMIANISGMICDGAKPGCSLKVTSGVMTAVLSATLAMQHRVATPNEGIVEEDIDRTINNLTRIGRDGMNETDNLIIDIMTHKKI